MSRTAQLWIDDGAGISATIPFDSFDDLQAKLGLLVTRLKIGPRNIHIGGTLTALSARTLPSGTGPVELHVQPEQPGELAIVSDGAQRCVWHHVHRCAHV